MHAQLFERGHTLPGALVRHDVEETHRRVADVDEGRADAHRIARPEHARELQLELERREAPSLGAHVAGRHPEHRGRVAVGGREAVDVVGQGNLAEDIDLVRLDRVP